MVVQLVRVVQVIGVCRWWRLHYVTCSGTIQIQRGMLLAVFQQDSYTKTLMCFQLVQVVWVESVCRWCPHCVTCSSQLLSVQVIAWHVQVKLTCTTPQVWCFVFNLVLFLCHFMFFSQCSAEFFFIFLSFKSDICGWWVMLMKAITVLCAVLCSPFPESTCHDFLKPLKKEKVLLLWIKYGVIVWTRFQKKWAVFDSLSELGCAFLIIQ